jgi:CHASE2 domain-containing sensor protein
LNYDNFDIWIEAASDNRYRVIVLPPSGVPEYLSDNILSPDLLSRLAAFDKNESTREDLKKVGVHLFNSLFHGTILNKFNVAFGKIQDNESMGLRIRLLIAPPAIAALPWELLYDPDRDRFLATWNKTPVTRFIKNSEGNRQLAIKPPVRVLVAIPGVSGLDVAAEERIVRSAFKELESKGLVHLEFMPGRVSATTIANKLNEGPPFHIFHFIGHGCFKTGEEEGYLLVNPDSETEDAEEYEPPQMDQLEWLCAEDFADLFMNHPSMKLIVLNSCKGAQVSSIKPLAGVVPKLFGREIPAVVAMQYPIYDDAALRFSSQFYRTLCKGYERGLIDAAVTSARNLMHLKARNELSFATPVLFMRSDSGAIFDLKEKEPAPIPVSVTLGPGGGALMGGDGPTSSPVGIVTSIVARLWWAITAPVRLVSEAPRLRAVKDAHDETLKTLETRKGAAGTFEEAVELEHEIQQERREVETINSHLSGVVKATMRITRTALALSLIVLLASTFGLFNVVGIDDYFQKLSYNYLRSERLGGRSFGDDQIRVILVDKNTRIGSFPNPKTSDDRPYHAEMIDALAQAGASVVALDIFPEESTPSDEKLATAITQASQKGTQVIMGTVGVYPTGEPRTRVPETLQEPLRDKLGNIESAYIAAGFRPAVRAVKLGDAISEGPRQQTSAQGRSVAPSFVIEAIRQFKRQPRSQPPSVFFNENDNTVRLVDKDTVFPIPVDGEGMLYYFGVPDFDKLSNEFARVTSIYQDIYPKRDDPKVQEAFRGKIVMIGYEVDRDMHYVNGVRRMPGVQIQAAVASNILQRVHLRSLSTLQNFLVILMMVALGWILQTSRLRRFSIKLPFESRVLKKLITIPLPLMIVTLLYLAAIYLIYSRTSWVVGMTYHIAALFFSYWTASLLRETRANSFASLPPAPSLDRKDVIEHA